MTQQQPFLTAVQGARRFACSAVAVQAIILNTDERILLLSSPTRNRPGEWQIVSGGLEAAEAVLGGVVLAVFAIVLVVCVLVILKTVQAVSGDPSFWEWEIRRFEREDQHRLPPTGGIVFTGSSSIRFWKTLEEDMAPLPVVKRGFGGSQIHQVTYYVDRIILPYNPRAVVLYAGENDIAGVKFSRKKSAEEVLEAFKGFCEAVHAQLPEALIYFLSIKPPKQRARLWSEMRKANRLVEEFTASDQRIRYVDVATAMLDTEGEPRADLIKWDGLHMRPEGYAIWTAILKPLLERAFADGS